MIEYLVYDVFTDTPFGGNQLAVFPDARNIPETVLQNIASKFNFSEVTFVYPPKDPHHSARVRIFTPTSEIGFAGHPIIGTVIALGALGYPAPMVLELGVGPIACTLETGRAAFTTHVPLKILGHPKTELVANCLGLKPCDIETARHGPVQLTLGLPFVCVELTNSAALSNCAPQLNFIKEGAVLHPAGGDFALFVYVRAGQNMTSRMFAPLDNISEDPATGSASATLAAYLTGLEEEPQVFEYTQGEDMGRRSKITAKTTFDPPSVTITGQAVKIMQGDFILREHR